MGEPVALGNVEAQVMGYLTSLLDVPSVRVVPRPRPDRFVRVLLTGTRRTSPVTADAQVTVECWAPTDAAACDLARQVYGHLCALDLPDGTFVPPGEDGWVGGPYASADPDSGTPRYVMTAIVRQAVLL
ncbi:MAG: hypothetical protein FWH11_01240 [Micrococcales bacterium]|nr:hypothetical protein [Micrococcales bacterium]